MNPREVNRPWGSERIFSVNEAVSVKTLYVSKGEAFSLQSHSKRSEFWHVISGEPLVTLGDESIEAKAGDEFSIEVGQKHRISAPKGDVSVLEISHGQFDQNDIVRFEDKYGRV